MSNHVFKIGDRVKIIKTEFLHFALGKTGVIDGICVNDFLLDTYIVKFDIPEGLMQKAEFAGRKLELISSTKPKRKYNV